MGYDVIFLAGGNSVCFLFGLNQCYTASTQPTGSLGGQIMFLQRELLFLVPGGTYFHLEPSHAVHTRLRKD